MSLSITQDTLWESVAPGRMDVMGGIADYSGSLVLQMALPEKTTVKLKLRDDFLCNMTSYADTGEALKASVDFRELLLDHQVNLPFANAFFQTHKKLHWAAYVLGGALILQQEKGINFKGADIEISTGIPLGKGVSSSAALEVATLRTLGKAFNIVYTGTELAILAQQVENKVVGAPCGLMDQLSSCFGEPSHLLPILCQPDKLFPLIHIPEDISFMGIDSGVRHAVSGASYGDVRCAAFMGYAIIAQMCGTSTAELAEAREKQDHTTLPFRGYLSNIYPEEFEKRFHNNLPEVMSGEAFLSAFKVITDSVSQIHPDRNYSIRACTSHPVHEMARVQRFKDNLAALTDTTDREKRSSIIAALGQLMYASHQSYGTCGLGEDRTNEIVREAQLLSSKGIAGAKITGGGSGGTVCLLAVGEQGRETVRQLHQRLCDKYQMHLKLFTP
jgi:L-arabinokinase